MPSVTLLNNLSLHEYHYGDDHHNDHCVVAHFMNEYVVDKLYNVCVVLKRSRKLKILKVLHKSLCTRLFGGFQE